MEETKTDAVEEVMQANSKTKKKGKDDKPGFQLPPTKWTNDI
jgi:hypothetical protein